MFYDWIVVAGVVVVIAIAKNAGRSKTHSTVSCVQFVILKRF